MQSHPDSIAREWVSAWRVVERKALGMTREHAKEFRRMSRASLARKMMGAHAVSEADINSAVAGYLARQAEAAAQARAAADNAARAGKVGYVGVIPAGVGLAASYPAVSEWFVAHRANDEAGKRKLIEGGHVKAMGRPTGVRILEVFDYRVIGKGVWLRVRVTTGPDTDKDGYCFSYDVK